MYYVCIVFGILFLYYFGDGNMLWAHPIKKKIKTRSYLGSRQRRTHTHIYSNIYVDRTRHAVPHDAVHIFYILIIYRFIYIYM